MSGCEFAVMLMLGVPYAAPAPAPSSPGLQYTLDGLCSMALERHPKLQQSVLAIDAARGKAVQAGLYPNPQLQIAGDEIGDRTGPWGIWTAPWFTQEFVTGGKLKLSKAAACREVDQASLALAVQRFMLLTAVRQAYVDVLSVQRRVELLESATRAADRSGPAGDPVAAAQLNPFDLNQIDFERDKIRADLESARRELPAAFRRLAAAVGVPDLPEAPLWGSLEDPLPSYELDPACKYVLCVSPELQSARIGIEKARLLLCRAQAEVKPNLTLGANYVHQGQNRSSDLGVSFQMPVPVWNKNQGNIQTAQAQLGDAIQEVSRVEADLVDRVAAAVRDYESARQRANQYRDLVLPRGREMVSSAERTFQAGKLEYPKIFEARRASEQAAQDYAKSLADAWKAAATIAGLTMEEAWPPAPKVDLPHPTPEPASPKPAAVLPPPEIIRTTIVTKPAEPELWRPVAQRTPTSPAPSPAKP